MSRSLTTAPALAVSNGVYSKRTSVTGGVRAGQHQGHVGLVSEQQPVALVLDEHLSIVQWAAPACVDRPPGPAGRRGASASA